MKLLRTTWSTFLDWFGSRAEVEDAMRNGTLYTAANDAPPLTEATLAAITQAMRRE